MFRDFFEDVFKPWLAASLLMIIVVFAVAACTAVTANASTKRLSIAKQYIGLKEGTRRANKAMKVNTRRVLWCGHFVERIVVRTGKKAVRGYPSARAWESFGRGVKPSQARKGDIVTVYSKYARSGRHVGIFSHKSKGRYCLVSGNSRNSVRTSCYRSSSVRKVRR